MAERFRFFDSIDGEDERFYTADEFAEYFRQFIRNGIFNGGENLKVGTGGKDMKVFINPGYAWIEGYLYKIDTEPLILEHSIADPELNRIDRVIIRLDKSLEKRYVRAFILKGTPEEEPVPPKLTRNDNVYEISLAEVQIFAGKSFIDAHQITDERLNNEVCGLVTHLFEQADTVKIFNQYQDWFNAKTSKPDGEFYREWKSWFEGIIQGSYLTKDNADGYYLSVDNIKTDDFNKGRYQSKFGFTNLQLDNCEVVNGDLKLRDIVIYENKGASNSHSITSLGYVGSIFTALQDFTGSNLNVTVKMKRTSIPQLRLEIWTTNDTERPYTKIGEFRSNSYSDVDADYSEKTFTIAMTEQIEKGRRYCLIACSNTNTEGREMYWAYSATADTNQNRKYLRSTNAGGNWTEYSNRYLWFDIPDLAEVPLSGIAIDKISIDPDCKWGNLKWQQEIPENSSIEVDILDENDNLLKPNISSITDLSDINPIEHRILKVLWKLKREIMENRSPTISSVSWTWEGSLNSTEIIYSGMATGEDLTLTNLNFKKYNLVRIFVWMVIDNYNGDDGYFKINETTIVSRSSSISEYGYYLDFSIYGDVVRYGYRGFSKAGDSQTAANEFDIVNILKSLINNRIASIPVLQGENNSIEIASGKDGTGNYIIKIIGYR